VPEEIFVAEERSAYRSADLGAVSCAELFAKVVILISWPALGKVGDLAPAHTKLCNRTYSDINSIPSRSLRIRWRKRYIHPTTTSI
jgi:hypothetical protein